MEWPRAHLVKVAEIIMGQSPPGDTYNNHRDGLPFFQGKADFGDRHPTTRKWCSTPNRIAESGDILLSVRAPVGPTNVASERCCIGRGLAAIRAHRSSLDQGYLRLLFQRLEPTLSLRGHGSTFAAIKRREVESLLVPLPPLSEQRRIVEILDQADRLRRLRAEADAKADRILPALYRKLFLVSGERWQKEALGAHLRKKKGALQSGPFGSHLHNSDFVEDGPVRVVGIDNVLDGEFSPGRDRRITEEKYLELKKYTLDVGDVLITIMGTIGRTCVFPSIDEPAICTKHVYRTQLDEHLDPEYVSASIRFAPAVRTQLGASITGQIVAGITSEDIRRLVLPIPPIELQKRFSDASSSLAVQREMWRRGGQRIERLFSNLLHHAFSGELTASWRRSHMKELLQEMEQQARALATV